MGTAIADLERMRDPHRLLTSAKGVVAAAGSRTAGYVGHVLGGAAWPRVAYRFGWGPSAPAIMQGVFATAGELRARKPDPHTLILLGLLEPDKKAVAATPTVDELERLMNRAHAAGITGMARSFGSLVRGTDGSLRFGELAHARKHHHDSIHFAAARDEDRRAFNRVFGTDLLTEASARQALQRLHGAGDSAPGYGPARSEFACRRTMSPVFGGKRVLDLGSKGAAVSLMLRSGARSVLAIEPSLALAELARLAARLLSWRDMRSYDVDVLTGDLRLLLTSDLGTFDVVTSLCPVYRLSADDMAHVVRKAASMDASLILQADEGTGDASVHTLDLRRLMQENGYPDIVAHAPEGLLQPWLVGRPPGPASAWTAGVRSAAS